MRSYWIFPAPGYGDVFEVEANDLDDAARIAHERLGHAPHSVIRNPIQSRPDPTSDALPQQASECPPPKGVSEGSASTRSTKCSRAAGRGAGKPAPSSAKEVR